MLQAAKKAAQAAKEEQERAAAAAVAKLEAENSTPRSAPASKTKKQSKKAKVVEVSYAYDTCRPTYILSVLFLGATATLQHVGLTRDVKQLASR